jgi:hypothetical protein
MESTIGDPDLLFKRKGDKLMDLCAGYVDDTLQAGNSDFIILSEQAINKFQCRPRERNNLQFAGVKIESEESEIIIHQRRYVSKFKTLDKNATFSQFRSFRAKLSWITQIRPEI